MDVQVTIVIAGVVIVIVVAYLYYQNYLKRRAAALAGGCGLFTDAIFPDECLGVCPPAAGGVAQGCTVLTTRGYGPFGALGTQAATCGCRVLPPPPAGGAPGAGVAPITESTTTGR